MQQHWNVLEDVILGVVDSVTPLVETNSDLKLSKGSVPSFIKAKMNKRKNLLKIMRVTGSLVVL